MIECKTVQEAAKMTEKRTDLALEARESFPRNHVEIQGVVLEKEKMSARQGENYDGNYSG